MYSLKVQTYVDNFVNALHVSSDRLQLRAKEVEKIVNHLDNVEKINAYCRHVVCPLKQLLAVELPPDQRINKTLTELLLPHWTADIQQTSN